MSAPISGGWTAHEITDRVYVGGIARARFEVLTRRRARGSRGDRRCASEPPPRLRHGV